MHRWLIRAFRTAAILFVPVAASAQPPDPAWSTLHLKAGEKIIVTDRATAAVFGGRIRRVADDGLVLADGSTRHTLLVSDVSRIERTKDRVWDGAFRGYAVGFLTGMTMVLAEPCTGSLCLDKPAFGVLVGSVFVGPIGMGVGALADALMRRPRVVFERHASPVFPGPVPE